MKIATAVTEIITMFCCLRLIPRNTKPLSSVITSGALRLSILSLIFFCSSRSLNVDDLFKVVFNCNSLIEMGVEEAVSSGIVFTTTARHKMPINTIIFMFIISKYLITPVSWYLQHVHCYVPLKASMLLQYSKSNTIFDYSKCRHCL